LEALALKVSFYVLMFICFLLKDWRKKMKSIKWKRKLFSSFIAVNMLGASIITGSVAVASYEEQAVTAESEHFFEISSNKATNEAIFKDKNGRVFFGKLKNNKFSESAEIVAGEVIVKYNKNKKGEDSVNKDLSTYEIQSDTDDSYLKVKKVKVKDSKNMLEVIEKLRKNPHVEYVEPNFVYRALAVPNDPYYRNQWGPKYTLTEEAWDLVSSSKRSSIVIAIVDTGVRLNHEDLGASIVPGYDFVDRDNDATDTQGHGTHVAGTAAALTNNGKGVAGICSGCKILPVRVLGTGGSGSMNDIASGIRYAADRGAHVINLSLGGGGYSSTLKSAIDYAISMGSVVVAASGNDNGAVAYPGAYDGVVTVGSIDSRGIKSSFSNYGPSLDVTAPGSSIFSSTMNGSYGNMSGTSMATPHVAGVVGLVLAANPNLRPDQVLDILRKSGMDKGAAGFDHYYGYGVLDTKKAVELALGGNAPTPPPPTTDTQAPSTPANLTITGQTSSTVTLSWNASADNVGVTGYNVYLGSTLLGTVARTSATVSGLSSNTSYTFSVRSVDAAGNVSGESNRITVTTESGSTPTPTPDPDPSPTAWAAYVSYKVGDIVTYNGKSYSCIQAHTSLPGWEPSNVPALWGLK
jgi:thermitase